MKDSNEIEIDEYAKLSDIIETTAPIVNSDLDKTGGVALRNQVIENCNNYIIIRQNSYDSSAEWEKVIGQEKELIILMV